MNIQSCSQSDPKCMSKDQFMKYIKGLKVVVHTIRPEINLDIKSGNPTVYKDIVHDVSEFSDFL